MILTSEAYVDPVASTPPTATPLMIFPTSSAPLLVAVYWMATPTIFLYQPKFKSQSRRHTVTPANPMPVYRLPIFWERGPANAEPRMEPTLAMEDQREVQIESK